MMRGWKPLDHHALSNALRGSSLCSDPYLLDALSVSDLFDLYSYTMNELLGVILPLRKVKTRCRPLALWFDSE